MEWILIIYVLSGDHHSFITEEFRNEKYCVTARDWINKQNPSYLNKSFIPRVKAECFRKGR
jgi:hypothetical protein